MSHRHGVFILLIALTVLLATVKLSPQTDADWGWVDGHFNQVLDDLLPLQQITGSIVAYRSHRDLYTEVPEYSFTIGHDADAKGYGLQGYLSAHVGVADTVSIYDQMMRMHRADTSQDALSVQKNIRLKRWDLTEMNCPSIKDQVEKLQKLQFKPPEFDVIVLHPLIHEFRIQAGLGDMNIVLVDAEHPLVNWALETRLALDHCIAVSH